MSVLSCVFIFFILIWLIIITFSNLLLLNWFIFFFILLIFIIFIRFYLLFYFLLKFLWLCCIFSFLCLCLLLFNLLIINVLPFTPNNHVTVNLKMLTSSFYSMRQFSLIHKGLLCFTNISSSLLLCFWEVLNFMIRLIIYHFI